jgi:O-antigen/teichoic acid export membrane protein
VGEEKLKRQRLLKDMLGMLGTRIVWSAMGVLSGVVLARWLGPENRGILALVLLIPSTVVTVVKFGVSQANVYTINRQQVSVDRVASNSLVMAAVLGTVSALCVWMFREDLSSSFLRDVPDWALALALLRVPMLLLDNYLFSILQATGKFGIYNVRLLMSEATRLVLVLLALVVFDLGLVAVVLIYTGVWIMNIVWLLITMGKEIRFSLSLDLKLLRETLSFGARSYAQTLTTHFLQRISFYMVSYYLGAAHVAFYAIALRFTEMVLEIPQAVGLVLYPRLAALPEDEIHRLTAQACRRTLMITAPAALTLALVGPWVVRVWYGEAFAEAGGPLPWAALGIAMMSIYVIVTRDFTSRAKQRINTLSGLAALGSNIALNLILIPSHGVIGAAMATALSYTIGLILLLSFFLYESGVPLRALIIPTREDLEYFADVAKKLLKRVPGMG